MAKKRKQSAKQKELSRIRRLIRRAEKRGFTWEEGYYESLKDLSWQKLRTLTPTKLYKESEYTIPSIGTLPEHKMSGLEGRAFIRRMSAKRAAETRANRKSDYLMDWAEENLSPSELKRFRDMDWRSRSAYAEGWESNYADWQPDYIDEEDQHIQEESEIWNEPVPIHSEDWTEERLEELPEPKDYLMDWAEEVLTDEGLEQFKGLTWTEREMFKRRMEENYIKQHPEEFYYEASAAEMQELAYEGTAILGQLNEMIEAAAGTKAEIYMKNILSDAVRLYGEDALTVALAKAPKELLEAARGAIYYSDDLPTGYEGRKVRAFADLLFDHIKTSAENRDTEDYTDGM